MQISNDGPFLTQFMLLRPVLPCAVEDIMPRVDVLQVGSNDLRALVYIVLSILPCGKDKKILHFFIDAYCIYAT